MNERYTLVCYVCHKPCAMSLEPYPDNSGEPEPSTDWPQVSTSCCSHLISVHDAVLGRVLPGHISFGLTEGEYREWKAL